MSEKSSFWKFKPCDKYDQIIEGQHDNLYLGALADRETGIERVDKDTFILYGNTEALLMRPIGFVYRLGIELLGAFLGVLHE